MLDLLHCELLSCSVGIHPQVDMTSTQKLVSLVDKIHNMENMMYAASKDGEAFWEKMSGGKERLWFDRAMIQMFQDEGFEHPLIQEYEKLIGQVEELT